MLRHLLLCALLTLLASLNALAQPTPGSSAPATCDLCRERLGSLEALRAQLPADWSLRREREPVWNSEMLVLEAGQENFQTLLLVHGLGQNGFTDWVGILPELAREYHVVALDLPGFGYSDSPSGKYSPSHYARVLKAMLDRHARGPAVVVGHSMGGAVSLRLAAEHPELISRLILVDAAGILHRTAFVKHSVTGRLNGSHNTGFLRGVLERVRDFSDNSLETVFGLPDPTRALAQYEGLWGGVLSSSNANAAMALVDEDFSRAVNTLPVPTWLIWGEADPVAPLRTGQMLARRLPQAQLLSLPGVGHTPMEIASRQNFMRLLQHSLAHLPHSPRPETDTAVATLADYTCRGEHGGRISGRFRSIRIEGCSGVLLQDLSAEQLVIRDSIVQMVNVQLNSPALALDVVNSELVATASEISGHTAIRADKARLDLAGVLVESTGTSVKIQRSSRLIASVCRIDNKNFKGFWHNSQNLTETELWP